MEADDITKEQHLNQSTIGLANQNREKGIQLQTQESAKTILRFPINSRQYNPNLKARKLMQHLQTISQRQQTTLPSA